MNGITLPSSQATLQQNLRWKAEPTGCHGLEVGLAPGLVLRRWDIVPMPKTFQQPGLGPPSGALGCLEPQVNQPL